MNNFKELDLRELETINGGISPGTVWKIVKKAAKIIPPVVKVAKKWKENPEFPKGYDYVGARYN